MTAIVFKFFRPNGECRRVTFDTVPDFSTVSEVANELVPGGGADKLKLTYTDSDGDTVLIQSSQDVAGAARDAKEAGAKSVRVVIRGAGGRCGGRRQWHRAAGGGRCGGLFSAWHPQQMTVDLSALPDEWSAAVKLWHATCGGFNIINDATEDVPTAPAPSAPNAPDAPDVQATAAPPTTTAGEAAPAAQESVAASASTAAAEPAVASPKPASSPRPQDFTFVEHAQPTTAPEAEARAHVETAAPPSTDELDGKVALLKEMGFDLPRDIARNMIRELGGRMDLIVRALVANGCK